MAGTKLHGLQQACPQQGKCCCSCICTSCSDWRASAASVRASRVVRCSACVECQLSLLSLPGAERCVHTRFLHIMQRSDAVDVCCGRGDLLHLVGSCPKYVVPCKACPTRPSAGSCSVSWTLLRTVHVRNMVCLQERCEPEDPSKQCTCVRCYRDSLLGA
jgi:hypothetical protein